MVRKKKDTLYSITPVKDGYNVYKLDEDFEQTGFYIVSEVSPSSYVCNCPAWKSECKHIKMVRALVLLDRAQWIAPYTYSLNQQMFIQRKSTEEE